ncbi:MAG: tyrosine-type recombinase/integrase [Phycisphaerales bacterium]|nr:tyrosine-type recombinase/integrase [Phycisphaerales bacterium]
MSGDLILAPRPALLAVAADRVPALVVDAGPDATRRYLEFFAASIRNPNTRSAYLIAAEKFFAWCEHHAIGPLPSLQRLHIAAYIEQLTQIQSAPTVKQNLAALRMLFAFLRVPIENPAEGVRGPKHVVRAGRTPVLSAGQARTLLDSIPTTSIAGLRDRALLSVMVYSFGRISAVVGLDLSDYHYHGARRWFRLYEKGGKEHAVPVHHRAEEYLDAYIGEAGIAGGPLFRATAHSQITERRLSRFAAWEMVKRRAKTAGLPASTTNHTLRATGITVYLENGGTIENARNIAAHASLRTTQCYDRRSESVTLDEISRIRL